MDNYEAISYACVALRELQKEDKEIDTMALRYKMMSLMDRYTGKEICEKYGC